KTQPGRDAGPGGMQPMRPSDRSGETTHTLGPSAASTGATGAAWAFVHANHNKKPPEPPKSIQFLVFLSSPLDNFWREFRFSVWFLWSDGRCRPGSPYRSSRGGLDRLRVGHLHPQPSDAVILDLDHGEYGPVGAEGLAGLGNTAQQVECQSADGQVLGRP